MLTTPALDRLRYPEQKSLITIRINLLDSWR